MAIGLVAVPRVLVSVEAVNSWMRFAAFDGKEPPVNEKDTHAVNEYPARLMVPLEAHSGTTTVIPRAWLVEKEPMDSDMARERLPVCAWLELTVMLVMPALPAGSPFQPSVVPDSKPQFRQLGPDVQATAATPW